MYNEEFSIYLLSINLQLLLFHHQEALEVLRTASPRVELRVCRPPPDTLESVTPPEPPTPPTRTPHPPPLPPLDPLNCHPMHARYVRKLGITQMLTKTLPESLSSSLYHFLRSQLPTYVPNGHRHNRSRWRV